MENENEKKVKKKEISCRLSGVTQLHLDIDFILLSAVMSNRVSWDSTSFADVRNRMTRDNLIKGNRS